MVGCVFCEIVARRAPARIVCEDSLTIVFMDIRPITPGHLLVVPKRHVADLAGLDEATGRVCSGTRRGWPGHCGARGSGARGSISFSPTVRQPGRRSSTCTCTSFHDLGVMGFASRRTGLSRQGERSWTGLRRRFVRLMTAGAAVVTTEAQNGGQFHGTTSS